MKTLRSGFVGTSRAHRTEFFWVMCFICVVRAPDGNFILPVDLYSLCDVLRRKKSQWPQLYWINRMIKIGAPIIFLV